MDGEQTSSAIELAADIVVAQLSFHRDWQVETDMAVTGVEFHVSRKILGNFKRDASGATMSA